MYKFLLHKFQLQTDRPFMDVQHFDCIIECEYVSRVIDSSQLVILQVYIEGPR